MAHMADELVQAYENFDRVIKSYTEVLQLWQSQLRMGRSDDDLRQLLNTKGLDWQDVEEAFNSAVRFWIRQTGHFPDLAEDMLNYLTERGFVAYNLKTLHTNYKVFPIEKVVVPITTNKEKDA